MSYPLLTRNKFLIILYFNYYFSQGDVVRGQGVKVIVLQNCQAGNKGEDSFIRQLSNLSPWGKSVERVLEHQSLNCHFPLTFPLL
ncbi:hypothetical protein ES705_38800 [subsurface metagenome]